MYTWTAPNGEELSTSQITAGRKFVRMHKVCKLTTTNISTYSTYSYVTLRDKYQFEWSAYSNDFDKAVNALYLMRELNK